MLVLRWICFFIVCADVIAYIIAYIIDKTEENLDGVMVFGVIFSILARLYVLYGLYTCWLVK